MSLPVCVKENVSLKKHCYYRIGGNALYFATPRNIDELPELVAWIKKNQLRYYILGAGSNTLFDDLGFNGVVINTSELDTRLTLEGETVDAGCSVTNIQLLRLCMREGLRGLDFLVGIPGNVGGAVFMNAGTQKGEVVDSVFEVSAYNLANEKIRSYSTNKKSFIYRSQTFLAPHEIIIRSKFRISRDQPERVQNDIQDLLLKRKKSQPIDKPSCGSVFQNPSATQSAWKLISDAGLRGRRAGDAEISTMHCNFIVNNGNAKSADVRSLIELAKKEVKAQFGILLKEEVKIIPQSGGILLGDHK
ncbi:MAG TPA: UDP-N-acetylmuramate dehydrogenase [Oligoflexia bacterium]|nr:UDP-N-acetylmuramate dehydrogenase [Oligoflexia bacterium]